MLKNKTRKYTKLKVHKVTATAALLYGYESWVTEQRDKKARQENEIRFLRKLKG
jgi:hypothetical protein